MASCSYHTAGDSHGPIPETFTEHFYVPIPLQLTPKPLLHPRGVQASGTLSPASLAQWLLLRKTICPVAELLGTCFYIF